MDTLRIALALHSIAMVLDDGTFNKIKPYLDTIQEEVLKETERKKNG